MLENGLDRALALTYADISSNATNIDISAALSADQLLQAGLAELGVVKECRVRVNVGVDTFVDNASLGVHLEILVQLSSPGVLHTVPWPENLAERQSYPRHRAFKFLLVQSWVGR